MSRYINGINVDDDNSAVRVVAENETMKYYPKFRSTPDPDKIDPTDNIIYDGGSVDGR